MHIPTDDTSRIPFPQFCIPLTSQRQFFSMVRIFAPLSRAFFPPSFNFKYKWCGCPWHWLKSSGRALQLIWAGQQESVRYKKTQPGAWFGLKGINQRGVNSRCPWNGAKKKKKCKEFCLWWVESWIPLSFQMQIKSNLCAHKYIYSANTSERKNFIMKERQKTCKNHINCTLRYFWSRFQQWAAPQPF